MGIKVRVGTRDDVDALVEVECSDVEKWHHYSSQGRGDPASYDELSSLERTMHGGPWMDREALNQYWDTIERLGIISFIAEIGGKVVGHLDVLFSEELPLGNFLYLDVLMVHKDHRRKGIAKALIKEAERLARDRKVAFILVEPQQYEGPSGLTYRSCGFEKAFDSYNLETLVKSPKIPQEVQLVSIPQSKEAPIKTHNMMCGWYNISAKTWYYGTNPDLKMLQAFSCHALALSALTGENTYYFHLAQGRFNRSTGTLALWSPIHPDKKTLQDVFWAVKTAALWLGIEKLTTKTLEEYVSELEQLGFTVKSKAEPYLTKSVN